MEKINLNQLFERLAFSLKYQDITLQQLNDLQKDIKTLFELCDNKDYKCYEDYSFDITKFVQEMAQKYEM